MTENVPQKIDMVTQLAAIRSDTKTLMEMPKYKKMGEADVMMVVEYAHMLGMHPLYALNEGLYSVHGGVGWYTKALNAKIRKAGHSIVKDPKSNNTGCILTGTRKDNGDKITVTFTLEDAKRAGLPLENKQSGWCKYPQIMCFNRAFTILSSQLFPDVSHGLPTIEVLEDDAMKEAECQIIEKMITPEQIENLKMKLVGSGDLEKNLLNWCQVSKIEDLTQANYESMLGQITTYWMHQKKLKEKKDVVANTGDTRMASRAEPIDDGIGRGSGDAQLSLFDTKTAVGAKKGTKGTSA